MCGCSVVVSLTAPGGVAGAEEYMSVTDSSVQIGRHLDSFHGSVVVLQPLVAIDHIRGAVLLNP